MTNVTLHCGDCLDVMRTLPSDSVHSIVTDPPAGIAFMNKSWDKDKGGRRQWIAWMTEIAAECLRVIRPGGHALVWALPRTSHWTATAWEDAGFELRDCVYHIFGSGFPKSKNLGNGFGSALKPAVECWWLLRKPLSEKSLEANALVHGVGGLNIDQCRIGIDDAERSVIDNRSGKGDKTEGWGHIGIRADGERFQSHAQGRWPANLLLDDQAAQLLDEMSGERKAGVAVKRNKRADQYENGQVYGRYRQLTQDDLGYGDTGGASRYFARFAHDEDDVPLRFFYCAKASKRDRDEGLEGMPERVGVKQFNEGMEGKLRSDGTVIKEAAKLRNHHPTVKPTQLMRYLCRLVTPPNGTVLDPFMGSGSTGKAAKLEGFHFVGIEISEEYLAIAEKRIAAAQPDVKAQLPLLELAAAEEAHQ